MIEQEDKINKWNALFPHKLKLYTDLYDTLFAFVNYKIQIKKHLNYVHTSIPDNEATVFGLIEFYKLLNKYDEEAKILFGADVSSKVHELYQISGKILDDLGCSPMNPTITPSRIDVPTLQSKLAEYQAEIKTRKLEPELRKNFKKYL